VTKSHRYLNKTEQRLSDAGIRRSRFVPRGSLLMSICATVGRPVETQIDVCIHDGFVVFEQPLCDQSFLYYVLSSLEKDWARSGQTGSQMNLNTALIRARRVAIPVSRVEQRAIASTLSDVDALLAGLDQLVIKKRNLKQAVMQQLLTGKIRLEGFNEEWQARRLGEVVKFKKGQPITEGSAIPGPVPVIAGGKEPAYFHNKSNRSGKTITISASGSAGYVAFFNEPIFASDCTTIGESEDYSIEFVYYLLKWKQSTIYAVQTGGAQPHVHASDISPIEVIWPSLPEQVAIASILTDMDAEISALEARRDKTKALKQGMMQELLTGRTRLVRLETVRG
jgi:type I restriction enzyme S subunit